MPFDFALAISLRVSLISPLHVASSGRVPATSSSFLNAYLRFSKKLTELEERIWDLEREKLSAKKTEKQLARIDPAIGLAFREGYYLGYHREAFYPLLPLSFASFPWYRADYQRSNRPRLLALRSGL